MADQTRPSSEPVVDEMHWGVVLRSDLQDQRQETRAVVDNLRQDLRDHRQETNERLDRIESRLDRQQEEFNRRLDQQREEFSSRMDRMEAKAEARFYWNIGFTLTLVGAQTGLLLTFLT